MNSIVALIFCWGCISIFFTVMGLVTPTRTDRLRHTLWDRFGRLCDRLGIQVKNEKDE